MLSVVIATMDSERALVRTLSALVPGAAAGIVREVIVVDGHSQDDTQKVADIAGCQIITSSEPLAARLMAGAAAARAPWLLFLRPGMILDPVWVEATGRFMEDQNGTAAEAATFRPASAPSRSQSAWAEALFQLRLALGARPQPQQGLLISKRLYDELGGHRSDSAEPEGDLMRTLGRRIVMLKCESLDRSELPST